MASLMITQQQKNNGVGTPNIQLAGVGRQLDNEQREKKIGEKWNLTKKTECWSFCLVAMIRL